MGERLPVLGHDEIIVSVSEGRYLCNTRKHATLGRLADVTVTFGKLGTRWQRDALWPETWGRSYAMCGECWDSTRRIVESRRPGLVITEASRQPTRDQASASGA